MGISLCPGADSAAGAVGKGIGAESGKAAVHPQLCRGENTGRGGSVGGRKTKPETALGCSDSEVAEPSEKEIITCKHPNAALSGAALGCLCERNERELGKPPTIEKSLGDSLRYIPGHYQPPEPESDGSVGCAPTTGMGNCRASVNAGEKNSRVGENSVPKK